MGRALTSGSMSLAAHSRQFSCVWARHWWARRKRALAHLRGWMPPRAWNMTTGLFLRQRVARFRQLIELFILLIDAVGDPLLVCFAGSGGGLLDQLPDIVPKDRDPIVEFR